MLYHLFTNIEKFYHLPGARLFQYITFRAGMAVILSLLISLLIGKQIINYLRKQQIGELVRDLGLEGQKQKQGTPTMGGIIIILAIIVPCLLLARFDNVYILLMLLSTVWMAAIGFADDYIKVYRKDKDGLKSRFKVYGQVGLGLIVGVVMLYSKNVVVRIEMDKAKALGYEIVGTTKAISPLDRTVQKEYAYVKTTLTNVPFIKGNEFDYSKFLGFLGNNAADFIWIIFIPMIIFIVTAVSNAANLTDGIDGLATGVSAIIGFVLGIFAYVSSNAITADYLNILFIPNSGELVIFACCFIGACIGFLWYNTFPAQVFMGDTGSLTLGGIIAAMAIVLRKELLIPVLCGIFLIESLSVIIQVSYFKYTKKKYGEGQRIFLMSPLHHHFQKKGIHESKIVTRFWIVGILLAVITIITLKIR
ncbi:MAG: phospho-N-acetylmuramoyl-pentapeptide-transferase [Saprospiraceae bacterium]|nr:phospho-N-acetylmuramoyl-pentapeptide-transferase [Saprospiraceae bacterium]